MANDDATKEIRQVFELAAAEVAAKADIYGSSWKEAGAKACTYEMFHKADTLHARYDRGHVDVGFDRDLLNLINWAAFTYWLRNNKEK